MASHAEMPAPPPFLQGEFRRVLAHEGCYNLALGVLTEVDVAGAVSHARTPLLVMHGEADTFVPPYMARRIYDACSTKKRLDYFPGAGHCQACLSDPKRYFSEVFDFLGKLV